MSEREPLSIDDATHYDPDTDTYETDVDPADDRPPSRRVVETVAVATGTAPVELSPLYEVLDPDALDAILASPGGEAAGERSVSFRYEGHDVTAYGNGRVLASASGSPQA